MTTTGSELNLRKTNFLPFVSRPALTTRRPGLHDHRLLRLVTTQASDACHRMPPPAVTAILKDLRRKSRKSVIWWFEPGPSTRAGGLCAQRHARSAHRRAAALLENFKAVGEPWQQFPRGGSALRSSTGKIKVGLLVELSIMVPSNHSNHDSIPLYSNPQDEPRSPERSGCCSPPARRLPEPGPLG